MDERIEHLKMIEAIIDRMSQNSVHLKGWAVALISVVGALSASGSDKKFMILAALPLVAFWFLDSYYLQLERKYRILYENVRQGVVNDFDMNLSNIKMDNEQAKKICFCKCLFSKTEAPFYLFIGAAVGLVALMLIL